MDPFGYDKVDIPFEAFCETIESQIHAIDQRGKSGASKSLVYTDDRSMWMIKRRLTSHLVSDN